VISSIGQRERDELAPFASSSVVVLPIWAMYPTGYDKENKVLCFRWRYIEI
jgi:hypothetical protein